MVPRLTSKPDCLFQHFFAQDIFQNLETPDTVSFPCYPMFHVFWPLAFPRSLDGDLTALVKAAEPFDWERISFVLEVRIFIRWDGKSIYYGDVSKGADPQNDRNSIPFFLCLGISKIWDFKHLRSGISKIGLLKAQQLNSLIT